MKRPVYVIRDAAVGFGSPFIDNNDACARRNFAYAVNNNGDMSFSSKDFDLYRLGTFDSESGKFDLLPVPEMIVAGMSVFNEK